MRAISNAIGCLFLALAVTPGGAQTDEPRDSEVTERVEVELVLLDVTVVDKRREIVTGLTKEDFVLKIDDRKTPIASLDMHCPDAPVSEPKAVALGSRDGDWAAPDRARRIVLAVDYRHLEQTQRVEVLEQVRDAVARLHRSKEQLMIVALTDFLRVEQPWTTETDVALGTLERMENDFSLWEPPFHHLHDAPTFAALLQLTGLLGTIEGEKIVVLFSNWPSSGFHYDVLFADLASRSARARVSFYPVWTRGLTAHGTSRPLARLAVESGGRFTERTNDFSLGYARAQRDSTCRYTIGFYDSSENPEHTRRVVLRVDRRGVRVFHHDRFTPVDPKGAAGWVAEAGLAWPAPYVSDSVAVALLPLRPTGRRRWETVLAVQATADATDRVQLRAGIRRGNSRWLRPAETRDAPFSVANPYRFRPGSYVATATVSYPGEAEPRAATAHIELPALVGDGWLLVDPIVLRSLGAGRVEPEMLEGTALEGDPLLGRVPVLLQAFSKDVLFATTQLCRYGTSETVDTVITTVEVVSAGEPIFSAQTRLSFTQENGLHCGAVDQALPRLPVDRYHVTVRARPPASPEIVKRTSFVVLPGPPERAQAQADD